MAEIFFGITDTGKIRQNNEDDFIAQQSANSHYIIACVIDGVGGYTGGEIAAAIARETILQHIENVAVPMEGNSREDVLPLLAAGFTAANEKIWQEKQSVAAHKNMACVVTLAVADIAANQFYYAHLGDTRLYLFRDGSLVKISHDQSFVGFLEDSGRLTEKEAMGHPKRNEIDKALGFKNLLSSTDDIETGASPFLPGDMLLLCTDGLTDVMDKATITQIMAEPISLNIMGKTLIDGANKGGGKDNITVVLVKNDKAQQQRPATKPVELQKPAMAANENRRPNGAKTIAKGLANKNRNLVILLSLLVLGLSAFSVWQYLNYKNIDAVPQKVAAIPLKAPPNPQEIKLQKAIDRNKGKMFMLSDTAYRSPVVISRSVIIDRDSLHIKAKGNITFQCAPGFTGPAFTLTAKTKSILLDSITFQRFPIAISAYNSLQLKNVCFRDCKMPLQNMLGLANNKYISGSFVPTFTTDSLPKIK